MPNLGGGFNACAALATLRQAPEVVDDSLEELIRESIRIEMDQPTQDIIAGRNNNLPLMAWAVRIVGGVMFDRPDLVEGGVKALEQLTDLVAAHGSLPEFNSPTYHPVTLYALRVICLWGEERTIALASALERHLWRNMALRWPPAHQTALRPLGTGVHRQSRGRVKQRAIPGGLRVGRHV